MPRPFECLDLARRNKRRPDLCLFDWCDAIVGPPQDQSRHPNPLQPPAKLRIVLFVPNDTRERCQFAISATSHVNGQIGAGDPRQRLWRRDNVRRDLLRSNCKHIRSWILSDAKARRTRQCEAPYAATIQHGEQTCHPTAKRVSDQIDGAAQVELVKERVIMDHIIQHRIDTNDVVRGGEAGVYWDDESSGLRQREKFLKAAGRAGPVEIDQWFPATRLEDFDTNS